MAPPATRITAASAPGKVLLTGGYLVLDRAYSGLVLALDARMHVIVRQVQKEDKEETEQASEESNSAEDDNVITVESPQFLDAIWKYKAEPQPNGGGIKITQQDDGPPNHFVATSLSFALTYIAYVTNAATFGNLHITILADNAYYSETATSTSTSLTSASTISTSSSSASATAANKANAQSKPSRFANFGVKLQDAHKTGLGSSAALVTALTSALVLHATVQPEDLPMMRGRLHNLAQAAHCAAQGKVGSGFDIAAAIYGSCCYRRFTPEILEGLGTEDIGKAGFAE
ncbi:phosphomevalonate kinase, partial [Ascosphaera atra]